jgi:hypothetical protein
MHLVWRPNAYSKPDTNLITGLDIKTRQKTCPMFGFLAFGFQNKSNGLKGRLFTPLDTFSCGAYIPFLRKKPERVTRATHFWLSGGGRTASQLKDIA